MTASLQVDRLSVRFRLRRGYVRAVTDVSFTLRSGAVLALVGESGCGKSVLAAALLGLLPANADVRGAAFVPGLELLSAPERVLADQVRGRRIALVPQSVASALTPVRTARSQLEEVLRRFGAPAVRAAADALADRVGLHPADLDRYPHELSGGMAQRVVLALALAGDPEVIIADEPTGGLDRPLVERTVDHLRALADAGAAVLLITHDLRAAERVATDLAVMYASRLVEHGPAPEVLADPWHPYTAGLLRALPGRDFAPIPGHPPDLTALPDGCAYRPRCPHPTLCSGDATVVDVRSRRLRCGPRC